jgi:hypothetical protein
MAKKKVKLGITLTELFLVKADWGRTFAGEIRRELDCDAKPVVMGVVVVHEGKIWSKASTQKELMKNMDGICTMKLDMGLHEEPGTFTILDKGIIYLN